MAIGIFFDGYNSDGCRCGGVAFWDDQNDAGFKGGVTHIAVCTDYWKGIKQGWLME
jgi:hypothetical protein